MSNDEAAFRWPQVRPGPDRDGVLCLRHCGGGPARPESLAAPRQSAIWPDAPLTAALPASGSFPSRRLDPLQRNHESPALQPSNSTYLLWRSRPASGYDSEDEDVGVFHLHVKCFSMGAKQLCELGRKYRGSSSAAPPAGAPSDKIERHWRGAQRGFQPGRTL